jgi:outer membrane protein assembly factor BamB
VKKLLRVFKSRGLLPVLVLILCVAGVVLFQVNYVNADLATTAWPMFHHDLRHTGRSPHNGPSSPFLKWSYTTGGGIFSSPAVGSDGTIYVGSFNGTLYAINPDGSLKWSYPTGGNIFSSPAIGSDGTIYVGSGDHKLYAISDNGSLKWSYTTGGGIFSSPAVGNDGTIYVGSRDKNLYAITDNVTNGSLKWSYLTGDQIVSSPAIGSDGTVYVGSEDHKLYAISDNGSLKWSYPTGNQIFWSSPAIGNDGTIYVGSRDSKLYAITDNVTNGSLKWSYTTGSVIDSSPVIGSDGSIYVGSGDDKLYAISDNGSLKWSYPTGNFVWSSPAIGNDGTIYVGSWDDKLYAITDNVINGSLKWSYTTGSVIDSSPVIGSDGTIYVGSEDDNLYAIGQQPPTVTAVNPPSGSQGQTLDVTITGQYFTGATSVSFGALGSYVGVNSFTSDNDTQIIANITIASFASPGIRNVSVTTPGGTDTLAGGFTVNRAGQQTESIYTPTGGGIAIFTTDGGSIAGLTAVASTPCGVLSGFSFPDGFFSFNITNLTPGSTVTITITLPSNMPTNTQYWKCVSGTWVDCTSLLGSNDGDNVLTLTLSDGGLGDADGHANGTIVDPGGPAVPVPVQTPPAHRASPSLTSNFKPAQMSLQYLNINPQQTSANRPVTVLTNVVNTGDEAGSLNVALKINGQVEQTRMVSVGPQATQPVKFTITETQPGTYSVDIGGEKGSFTINGTGGKPVNGGLVVLIALVGLILAAAVVLVMKFRSA